MAKPDKSQKKAPELSDFRLDTFLIEITGKFGLTGCIVLVAIYTFLKNGTDEQKREFINKFILLKTDSGDNAYVIYLVIIAGIAFIGQRIYFRNKIKLKDERIEQLEKHNNSLENKLLKHK